MRDRVCRTCGLPTLPHVVGGWSLTHANCAGVVGERIVSLEAQLASERKLREDAQAHAERLRSLIDLDNVPTPMWRDIKDRARAKADELEAR